MKINRQFQDKHIAAPQTDWVLKQRIESDICLLYHQLANYSSIMGDLYYGDVFALPYWEFLNIEGIEDEERIFVRNGCLVMILAMCSECIDGSGSYIYSHIENCQKYLSYLSPEDEKSHRLIMAVKSALQLAQNEQEETPELTDAMLWVHREYVRGYFRKTVYAFDDNPYYGNQ